MPSTLILPDICAWIRYPGSDPDHPVAVIANPVNLDGNKWLNLAMTYDPSARSVRLYIDGSLAGEAIAPSDTLVQTVEPIRMGRASEADQL